jgi:hypothetical protein
MKLSAIDNSIKVRETIGFVSQMFTEVLIQLEEDELVIVEDKFMNLLWTGIWFIGTEIDKLKGII